MQKTQRFINNQHGLTSSAPTGKGYTKSASNEQNVNTPTNIFYTHKRQVSKFGFSNIPPEWGPNPPHHSAQSVEADGAGDESKPAEPF